MLSHREFATTWFRRGELAGLLRPDIDLVQRRVSPPVTRVVVVGRAQELALDPDTAWALEVYVDGSSGRILGRRADRDTENENWPGTKSQASGGSGGTAQICARPVDRRHSPVALDVCPGMCHPFLMVGWNHVARTVGAGPPWAVET